MGDFCRTVAGDTLTALEATPGVECVVLAGDRLRVISAPGLVLEALTRSLMNAGALGIAIVPGEPTLEDVFLQCSSPD